MNREEIICMAREAGVRTYPEREGGPIESLERFAALVRAQALFINNVPRKRHKF